MKLTRIPDGYRVAVVSPSGTIVDMVDVGDSDLRNGFAADDLGTEVMQLVERAEAQR